MIQQKILSMCTKIILFLKCKQSIIDNFHDHFITCFKCFQNMPCRDICKKYKATKKGHINYNNAKRCSNCCEYLKYDGVYCPCCNIKLRCKPRSSKARRKRNLLLYSSLHTI